MSPNELQAIANELRIWIIDMITEARSGHPGGSLSAIDVITALWFHEMRGCTPGNESGARDHFVLSKGHAVPALYAVLAKRGFIPVDELKTLRKTGSRLQGHPDRVRLPIVEASTGSLGQGLSVAAGMALGFKKDRLPSRVYCMMGDGEIQEGQIWEAAMGAAKYQLSNLCAVLDYNGGQIDGPVNQVMPSLEPIRDKWVAFGWDVIDINGHDMAEIIRALDQARTRQEQGATKPVLIIARTIKGKGVSFMEHKIEWHGVAPKPEEARKAFDELEALRALLGEKNG